MHKQHFPLLTHTLCCVSFTFGLPHALQWFDRGTYQVSAVYELLLLPRGERAKRNDAAGAAAFPDEAGELSTLGAVGHYLAWLTGARWGALQLARPSHMRELRYHELAALPWVKVRQQHALRWSPMCCSLLACCPAVTKPLTNTNYLPRDMHTLLAAPRWLT